MITSEHLHKLAKGIRIAIRSKEEENEYLMLINKELDALKILFEENVSGIEPMTNPYEMYLNCHADEIYDGHKVKDIITNSENIFENQFIVSKIVNKN